jgi:hypothetical protein
MVLTRGSQRILTSTVAAQGAGVSTRARAKAALVVETVPEASDSESGDSDPEWTTKPSSSSITLPIHSPLKADDPLLGKSRKRVKTKATKKVEAKCSLSLLPKMPLDILFEACYLPLYDYPRPHSIFRSLRSSLPKTSSLSPY